MKELMLTEQMRKRLPKARLFWLRHRPWFWKPPVGHRHWWAKFRNANAMFVWLGPLEIGWRMPWLEHAAMALHPELTRPEGTDHAE